MYRSSHGWYWYGPYGIITTLWSKLLDASFCWERCFSVPGGQVVEKKSENPQVCVEKLANHRTGPPLDLDVLNRKLGWIQSNGGWTDQMGYNYSLVYLGINGVPFLGGPISTHWSDHHPIPSPSRWESARHALESRQELWDRLVQVSMGPVQVLIDLERIWLEPKTKQTPFLVALFLRI